MVSATNKNTSTHPKVLARIRTVLDNDYIGQIWSKDSRREKKIHPHYSISKYIFLSAEQIRAHQCSFFLCIFSLFFCCSSLDVRFLAALGTRSHPYSYLTLIYLNFTLPLGGRNSDVSFFTY